MMMLVCVFQGCKSQNNKINFIYHTADYDLGAIYEERIYNSLTGIYEYKSYDGNKVKKNIKVFLKYNPEALTAIHKMYTSSKSEMSDCYFNQGILAHKSTLTFNSSKDNFNLVQCRGNENPTFLKIENEIERYITSSDVYRKTFYWEFYRK